MAIIERRRGDVRVRMNPRFTVITVNGVDVYFYRLTGDTGGVGLPS
jgi:hypothetical protein